MYNKLVQEQVNGSTQLLEAIQLAPSLNCVSQSNDQFVNTLWTNKGISLVSRSNEGPGPSISKITSRGTKFMYIMRSSKNPNFGDLVLIWNEHYENSD